MKGRYRKNRKGVEGWIRGFNRTQYHVLNQGLAWAPTGARCRVSLQEQMLPLLLHREFVLASNNNIIYWILFCD